MADPFLGRDAIISKPTRVLLDRMRASRHRERNSYGFALDVGKTYGKTILVISSTNASKPTKIVPPLARTKYSTCTFTMLPSLSPASRKSPR
jgi:hypothetical protein